LKLVRGCAKLLKKKKSVNCRHSVLETGKTSEPHRSIGGKWVKKNIRKLSI